MIAFENNKLLIIIDSKRLALIPGGFEIESSCVMWSTRCEVRSGLEQESIALEIMRL